MELISWRNEVIPYSGDLTGRFLLIITIVERHEISPDFFG